jgi:hypothetical protein
MAATPFMEINIQFIWLETIVVSVHQLIYMVGTGCMCKAPPTFFLHQFIYIFSNNKRRKMP